MLKEPQPDFRIRYLESFCFENSRAFLQYSTFRDPGSVWVIWRVSADSRPATGLPNTRILMYVRCKVCNIQEWSGRDTPLAVVRCSYTLLSGSFPRFAVSAGTFPDLMEDSNCGDINPCSAQGFPTLEL